MTEEDGYSVLVGSNVKVITTNARYYKGKLLSAATDHIVLDDRFIGEVTINKATIAQVERAS